MSSTNTSARPLRRQITITGPEHWASYLVNGDASGLSAEDKAQADAWLKRENVRILDVARDANGEPCATRFTWSYWLYAPEIGARGGSVLDYVAEVLLPCPVRAVPRPQPPGRN